MTQRWGGVVGLAAVAQLLFVQAARGETVLAQAAWPPPAQQPMPPPPPQPMPPPPPQPMPPPAGWPPPLQPPMQAAPPVQGPRVTLQVDNPNGRLQQFTPLRWRDACLAPCGIVLDPTVMYRIGGGTSIASEPFKLPRASGEVFIDADVGSKGAHWAGLGLMIGGGVAALYGALYLMMSSLFSDIEARNPDAGTGFGDTVRNIGLLALGLGVVLEVSGIVLFSKGTSVQVR